MRTLSVTELAMQDQVKASNREHFKRVNTSTMADYEKAGAGFEMQNGSLVFCSDEWMPVHQIRYSGITGMSNRFAL